MLRFSSAHILGVVAARWLGVKATGGRYLFLATPA
jgi:hypothetical protein